jgi:hypothetical protein
MLSVIIGLGGADKDVTNWGWHLYDNGAYRPMRPEERSARVVVIEDSSVAVWTANVAGVSGTDA